MAPEPSWLGGGADDGGLRFGSAGSHALNGNPATEGAVAAAAARGGDLARHRARELDRRLVRDADLILTMAAEHLPYVLAFDRSAAQRAFVLGAFARVVAELPSPARSPEQLVAMALAEGAAHDHVSDDVDDPIGGTPEAYAAIAEHIDELVTPVVAALAKLA